MVWVEYKGSKMHIPHYVGNCVKCGLYYVEFPSPRICPKCNGEVKDILAWPGSYVESLIQKSGKKRNELSKEEYIKISKKGYDMYERRQEQMRKAGLEELKNENKELK